MLPTASTAGQAAALPTEDAITASTMLSALQLCTPPSASESYAAHAQVEALHKSLELFLPSRTWSKIPLPLHAALISDLKLQHGNLPAMQVKVIHGVDATWANELDQALLWLHESIGQPYPVIGLHVESDHASIRLLQFATSSRCVMIRIPDRATLMAQAAALAADAKTDDPTIDAAASTLFTPLFFQLLSSRQIFKSGLEACTDALQLYQLFDFSGVHPRHPRFELNSGLNISWNMMQRRAASNTPGYGMLGATAGRVESLQSLEGMVDSVLGVKGSFRVDASQTYTDWGAERLNLRQVVYAALNAQVAYVIACTQSLPTPFHLSDLPRAWILHAASWRGAQTRQAEMLAAAAMGVQSGEDDPQDDPHATAALSSLSELYFARFTQGEEPLNPFISNLLQLGHSFPPPSAHGAGLLAQSLTSINPLSLEGSGLAVEPSNAWWWLDPVAPNERLGGAEVLEATRGLDGAQRRALAAMDDSRISVMEGGVGTGKSSLLVAAIISALDRSSSISLARAPPVVRMSAQRVLVLAEAPAALALTKMLARFLPSDRVCCVCAPTTLSRLDDPSERELLDQGYLQQLAEDSAASFALDRDVLLMTPDMALFHPSASRLLRCRQTLVFEDAHQLWLLKAVLLLRRLPHTERLILVGDLASLAPMVAKSEAESTLATAVTSSAALAAPQAFQPFCAQLTTQYRAPPHLAGLISSLFYRGALKTDERALTAGASLARKKRSIGWVDVPASSSAVLSSGGSWSNTPSEVTSLNKLWAHYVASGVMQPEEVAIVAFHSAAERELRTHATFGTRVFAPEQCPGLEVQVAFLCLSAPGVTHHLADGRRALVALSRACYKVYVLGDRDALAPYHSLWRLVEEYCDNDVADDIRRAELAARAAPPAPTPVVVEASLPPTRTVSGVSEISEAETISPTSSIIIPVAAPSSAQLPVISPEDAPRLANLYALFLSHASPPLHTGPLLIDTLGKHFKARFGNSWRNFEKLDRDAKLITFLAKYPALFRLSQNVEESVHVNVEWIGSAAAVSVLTAAAPRGLLTPVAASDVNATTDTAIDPWSLASVLTLDPSIPQLDGELIDALFQAILSVSESVLLSDLSKTFKTCHKTNWTSYTDLKLGEFLRKYSPAFFKFKNNTHNTRNPIVECVVAGLVPELTKMVLVEPPKTVIASNVVVKDSAALLRRPAITVAPVVAAAAVVAPSAPVKTASTSSTSSQQSDIFTQAGLLSSSVPASQIDDHFRLECLRLVFLHNGNCGLSLTEIGNAFHALHGLRWKRLTKTEQRVSDFMYEYERLFFEFDYEAPGAALDADGNGNPLVYFVTEHIDTPLFIVGAKGAPKRQNSGGAASAVAAAAVAQKKAAQQPPAREKQPKQKALVVAPDEFQPVVGRRQAQQSATVVVQQPMVITPTIRDAQTLCGFCQTVIAPGERACPNCDSLVDDVVPADEPKPVVVAATASNTKPKAVSSSNARKQPVQPEPVPEPVVPETAAMAADTPSPSPEPERDPYGTQDGSDFLSAGALEAMSKKERRKLSWLCPACKGCNEQRAQKCELCDFSKPKPEFVRYKNPVAQIQLPEKSASNAHQQAANGNAAPANPKAVVGSSAAAAAGNAAASARYENEWVRISHTEELGYHYVSAKPIPAGTNFLQDDVLWSSSAGALESAMGSCIPNEAQFSELIMKLLKDPVMVQLLSNRNITQYAMIGRLLNLKKPRDVGMKEWSAGVEMTLTGAQFQRETAPGHSKSCNCSYGRFWMKRQSALLAHSCWPNCAHVKRPSKAVTAGASKESHCIIATCDIPAGAVLTDCMNSAIINLPRDRRLQWITQTTGKATCTCDRCKTPRKADAQLTAVAQTTQKAPANDKLEEDYEAILKQYAKLNAMGRTMADDPAYSSPVLDERYFAANYDFLSSVHTFLTCYHTLSNLHWRKQYLRSLFVTLVAKNELYDLDLMHPDDRRLTTSVAAAAAPGAMVSTKSPLKGRWTSPLNPISKGYDETRSRHHWYLQMILSNVLSHLEANAAFYSSHEPLKCSGVFLMYALIDWFTREEHDHCVTTHTLADGTQVDTTCFSFTFDRRKRDIAQYLSERLKDIEPYADSMFQAGFPLRA